LLLIVELQAYGEYGEAKGRFISGEYYYVIINVIQQAEKCRLELQPSLPLCSKKDSRMPKTRALNAKKI
jgi:hypothetical protein